jgi:hypothetical protein
MHFKICRKASSSDDCERITGNPEVIGLSTGLVPRNAPAATDNRRREADFSRLGREEGPQSRGFYDLRSKFSGGNT